ncbi:hypothetical protein [Desulfatirhabdium butyrativorans]|uniref:hypothetical protein n=1 Tax=Desulfatirhabdium butyrativorans TaxID=340467 RepID=UPI000481760B|nr:hypothetical protein [Desulfatirhabdium butyrativorans]
MANTQLAKLHWKSLLPHILVLLWLVFLASTIWRHATESVQPPHFDPLSYMQKAMNFWDAVEQGEWFNPLNIEPIVRPPGTILMSYPFGFSPDYRGFYFRSAFLPILFVVLAVYWVLGFSTSASSEWYVVMMALFLSTIPIFYNFDVSEVNPGPVHWGLVDNFQAGVATLAAAGYIKSLQSKSLLPLALGSMFGSLTLMIKPSGLMVMALLTLTWVTVLTFEWISARNSKVIPSCTKRYVILGVLLIMGIDALAITTSLFSKYFSLENFEYAQKTLATMKSVLNTPLSILLLLVISSIGFPFVLWFLWKGVLLSIDWSRKNKRIFPLSVITLGFVTSAGIIWILGLWYWLVVQAGDNQVRYFYPFFLMGVMCLLPVSSLMFRKSGRSIRLTEWLLCGLAVFNIAALLVQDNPSLSWQRLAGVNVTVGQDREIVEQAHAFLEDIRRRNQPATVYTFYSGLQYIFATAGCYEGLVRPTLPAFQPIFMADWLRGFVVRTEELSGVDFIIVRKDLGSLSKKFRNQKIESDWDEAIVFQAWLCTLSESAGVRIASDGTVLRLLQIVDRKAFREAIVSFVEQHDWRPEFVRANPNLKWVDPAVSG